MMRVRLLLALGASAMIAPSLAAQRFDTTTTVVVAPGVVHRRVVVNSGPWHINVLEVDLHHPGISVRGVRANDSFTGREKLSSMLRRYAGPGRAVAGVNADFFAIRSTSESENNVVIEGTMWKGVGITDSPYDRFNAVHSQFGVDWENHPFIEPFVFGGRVITGPKVTDLDALNYWPDSGAMVLYTAVYGDSTPGDSTRRHPAAVSLRSAGRRGDTLLFRVNGKPRQGWRLPLNAGGALLAAGARRSELRALAASGALLRIVPRLEPNRGRLRTVVGGWPRLILHGRNVVAQSDSLEGTTRGFSKTRHPRTAVGFSSDSSKLFLITVDGRSESDSGMSLAELADAMLELGVYDGMNLDGGGSTTMVIDGRIVNSPSDKGGERAVGSGLLVIAGAQ